jgi:hypothetical protein
MTLFNPVPGREKELDQSRVESIRTFFARRLGRRIFRPTGALPAVASKAGPRIDLIEQARVLGKSNRPSSAAAEPGDGEVDIIHAAEREHAAVSHEVAAAIAGAATAFEAASDRQPTAETLDALVQEALAEIQQELVANRVLGELWQERENRRRDRDLFRDEHNLSREIDRTKPLLWELGILALLTGSECGLNGAFFAPGSPQGYLGGYLLAGAVSVVNVGAGLTAGFWGVRYSHHVYPRERRFGHLVLAGLIPFALLWNLAVAHLRDDGGYVAAGHSLLHHPVRLSLLSWGLFALGCSVWAAAVNEGYRKFSDRYPGYGGVDRDFQEAARTFQRERDALLGRILSRIRKLPKEADAAVDRSARLLIELERHGARAKGAVRHYDAATPGLLRRYERALRRWRSANVAARSTPAPGYFSAFPTFPDLCDRTTVKRLLERLTQSRTGHEALKAARNRIRCENAELIRQAAAEFDRFLASRLGPTEDAGWRALP